MSKELNLLLVEDNPVDATAVCKILDHAGFAKHTDKAYSLEQAKQKVRTKNYDAVILDLGLPDSQGVDGVIEFQATAPELPVVVLTGCADESTALKSMDVGAEDYLNKDSISESGLCRSLKYAIERHRRKRETFHDMSSLRHSLDDAVHEAATDPLTGVPNRRGLQRYLDQLAHSHLDAPLVVGVADLDHFKEINDIHGHNAGDHVLKEFAARLQHCMRGNDFLARVGGDEFVLVFNGLDRSEALGLGRRMLEHVSSDPVRVAGAKVAFSATMALAEIDPHAAFLEQILADTHSLLSSGKNSGRNRVECAWAADEGQGEGAAAGPIGEMPFTEKDLVFQMREVQFLPAANAPAPAPGHYLLFGLGSPAWPLAAPAINRFRMANRLGEMTLHCLKRAQEWRQKAGPATELHLDIEADAVKPSLCTELTHIFPRDRDRANCVLFLHSDFQSQPGFASLSDLRFLGQLGFRLGVRNVGDGSTILEHIQMLQPHWIRFDAGMTVHVGKYEKKAAALKQLVEMLRPLGAKFAADEVDGEEDLKVLAELGFSALYVTPKPNSTLYSLGAKGA